MKGRLLVTRNVYADHILDPEIKFEVGENKGGHKGPTGAIDVDPNVPAVLLVNRLCTSPHNLCEVAPSNRPTPFSSESETCAARCRGSLSGEVWGYR